MEKVTLNKKEAAALLGISEGMVTRWVVTGRLKAYRKSDKRHSPYLFTREDCLEALTAVPIKPAVARYTSKVDWMPEPMALRRERIDKELEELLRPKKRVVKKKKEK